MEKQLVLIRHGESQFNLQNRFTGWADVDLTPKGRDQARQAGEALRAQGLIFDVAFTSVLTRAIRTLWGILDAMDQLWVPVHRSWQLNDRHYGALQGQNKDETIAQYGAAQVKAWRKGFSVHPPALDVADPQHPRFDPRYAHLAPELLPATESFADAYTRVIGYYRAAILPELQAGKRVLITGHSGCLRCIEGFLQQVPESEIPGISIPTGKALMYGF